MAGTLLYGTHATVCACCEILELLSCSNAETSICCFSAIESLVVFYCRRTGVFTTCSSGIFSHSTGCFGASEFCALLFHFALAQSSVSCALSHDSLCRGSLKFGGGETGSPHPQSSVFHCVDRGFLGLLP